MKNEKIDLLLKFALANASLEDYGHRELGPIHLVKLVYLADLAYAAQKGETFTGIPWEFHHFGPWHGPLFQRLEPVASSLGASTKIIRGKDGDGKRWSLPKDDAANQLLYNELEPQLPFPCVSAIRRAIRAYGDSTYDLLHEVYKTPPMLNASPGAFLDFNLAREEAPQIEPTNEKHISNSERKRRKAKQKSMRERIKAAVEAKKKRAKVTTQPRYDDVFFEGVAWLDDLAGDPISESKGTLEFGDDVWNSDLRTVNELP